jgi:hypothetical protein
MQILRAPHPAQLPGETMCLAAERQRIVVGVWKEYQKPLASYA